MDLDVGCSFLFDAPGATHAVLLVGPHTSELARSTAADLSITQFGEVVPWLDYVDAFGNRCVRADLAPGAVAVQFAARVDVSDEPDAIETRAVAVDARDLPAETLQFLLPSRFCQSDELTDLAWSTFGSLPRDWSMVQAVTDWVHDRLDFRYGSSSPSMTATAVLDQGVGVCRDFAHLGISLCRALNVPARYVFGYLPDIGVPDLGAPMDFAAWTEVFLDGRWYTIDPRNNERRVGRVVIGRGRDAADVAMVTSFGRLDLVDMTVRAEPGSGDSWQVPIRLGGATLT